MAYNTTAKEFFEHDVQRVVAHLQGARGLVEFDIQGKGGGAWLVDLATNEVKPTEPGSAARVACIVRAQARDFMALVEGRMSPADGLVTERLHVAGDAVMIGRLWSALAAARAS
jgi:hypothetical protein